MKLSRQEKEDILKALQDSYYSMLIKIEDLERGWYFFPGGEKLEIPLTKKERNEQIKAIRGKLKRIEGLAQRFREELR
jgi:hypothetical protein